MRQDPRVLGQLEVALPMCPLHRIHRQDMLEPLLRIAIHRAQLQDLYWLAVASDTRVLKERRAGIDDLDREGEKTDNRTRHQGERQGNRKVDEAFRQICRLSARCRQFPRNELVERAGLQAKRCKFSKITHDEDLLRAEAIKDFRIPRQMLTVREEQYFETGDRATRREGTQLRQRGITSSGPPAAAMSLPSTPWLELSAMKPTRGNAAAAPGDEAAQAGWSRRIGGAVEEALVAW